MLKKLAALVVLVLALAWLGQAGGRGASAPSSSGADPMTMAKYMALENGMDGDAVRKIVGAAQCQELARTDVSGINAVTWQCAGASIGSNAVLMFQSGKLFSKSQIGLK